MARTGYRAAPNRRASSAFSRYMAEQSASLGTPQVHMRLHWFVARHQVGPILGVMIGVDDLEDGVLHVSVLQIAGNVEEIKFHGFSVGRGPSDHARPIAGIAIVRQEQAIAVQVKHGDGMIVASRIVRRS